MAITEKQLRAAGLPAALVTMLMSVQRTADGLGRMAGTVKQHMVFAEAHAKTAANARSGAVAAQAQVDAALGAVVGDRATIAQTKDRVTALEAKPAPVTVSGLRVTGGVLYLDLSNGSALQATLPASGGGTSGNVAPAFTTRPSLTGSTALGSTITVSLGAASGTPAPALTGILKRPGRAAAAVAHGATFFVEAADQAGTVELIVTAANAAGSVQDSVTRAIPPAPTVANVDDGGYKVGTTPTVTPDGTITITNTATALSGDLGVTHYFVRANNMLGKQLVVRRSTGQPNNSGSQLGMWQMAWSYDPHGDDWFAFDSVVNSNGTIIATKTEPLTQDVVYVSRRPVFTGTRWDRAIARWRANPLTAPTASGNAQFVIGTLPANVHAPAMDCYGFKFGSGPVAFVLTGNIHTDEHIAAYAYEGIVDWLLSDNADAVWLRQNLTIYCYPKINPQARYAGASRIEITSGENANRIFAASGFDHIPLSKLMRDAWSEDLPTKIGGHFDFHDTINGTGRGFVFHTNADAFLSHLQAVYSARTGLSVIVEPSTATNGIGHYMRSAYGAALSLAVEHEISRLVSIPEWQQWGRDFGIALRAHYAVSPPVSPPAPGPWQEPVWIPGDANVTVTRDTNGDWLITGYPDRNPVAALAIPTGKTIEVQFDGDGGSGSNATYIRQSAVSTLLIAQSTDLSPSLAGSNFSRLVSVTHDPAKPYVGIVQARTGTTRTLRMFASCRWREV